MKRAIEGSAPLGAIGNNREKEMYQTPYNNETKEKAFFIWYETRSDSKTEKELKELGYKVTRNTIAKWREELGWKERANNIDVDKQKASDKAITFEESLLLDLEKQKKRYDDYFNQLEPGKVDNQAMYVYNQLIEKLLGLKNKINPESKKEKVAGVTSENEKELKDKLLGL